MDSDSRQLSIRSLELRRAPGLGNDTVHLSGLAEGVTVCFGPNAIGKTTLARTIEAILWPDAAENGTHAVAHLTRGDERWRIELDHGSCTYQRDGSPADPPSLPAVHERHRYRLPLHELLDADTQNEPFAETIRRESAGGVDLAAAHEALDYQSNPSTRNVGAYQRAVEAIETYEEATRTARALERDRENLPDLRAARDRARRAKTEVRLLEDVLAFHERERKLAAIDAQLAAFPDVMDAVDGDEADRIEELDAQIAEWEATRTAAVDQQEEATTALASTALPTGGVPDGELDQLRQCRDRLAELERRADQLEEDLGAARETRERRRTDIPIDVEPADLADLEPVSWRELSAFSRAAITVTEREERVRTMTRWANAHTDEPPPDLEPLERATIALEHWLAAGGAQRDDERYLLALVVGSAVTVLTVGTLLGIVLGPVWMTVGVPGLVLLVALLWYLYGRRTGTESRAAHRSSFPATQVVPPEAWTEAAVRDRLFGLYDAIAERKRMTEGIRQREAIDLDAARDQLETRRRELVAILGAAPESTDVELTVAIKRILDWQEADERVRELATRLQKIDDQQAATIDAINVTTEPYGCDSVTTAGEATAAIRGLEVRERERKEAAATIERAGEMQEEALDRIATHAVDRRSVFASLDLDEHDLAGVGELCDHVEEYERLQDERNRARGAVAAARSELADREAFDPSMLDADPATLEAELVDARASAEEYDELAARVTEIETKIDAAKTETAVADAHLERERALDELAAQRNADVGRMVGDALVDHLRDYGVEAERPAVFERARELFAQITAGACRLEFDDASGAFRAYDTVQERGLALDELSSGTRVQLLLAVRLGFVERREGETTLPLLLDETLANSDDERARAIMESLIALARDGRSVLYFTARRDEVRMWERALAEDGTVAYSIVDLAAKRDIEPTVGLRGAVDREVIAPDPPAPECDDLTAYGEALEVPSIDPYGGIGGVHLWYLVPDVDSLYAACAVGIERWGQLETLCEVGATAEIGLDAETIEMLELRARALETMLSCWRVGRGEPIDRAVLEKTDAVSDTFIEEVTALARANDGNPQAVVDALVAGEVARFRTEKARALEAYLYEQGYLEDDNPLPDEEIRTATFRTFLDGGLSVEKADAETTELLERTTIK